MSPVPPATGYIPLLGKITIVRAVTTIDESDFERLSQLGNWHLNSGYAHGRRPDGSAAYLHREVLQLERDDPRVVDHINGDRLDNRRANLRIVTRRQNMENMKLSRANTSGYRGVSYDKEMGLWAAQIGLNGRRKHLGYYHSPETAAEVARAARRRHMPYSST
jgi:hypothetical protein